MVHELVNTILKEHSQMKYRENPVKNNKILWTTIGLSFVTIGLVQLSRYYHKRTIVENNNNINEDQANIKLDPSNKQYQTESTIKEPNTILTLRGKFDENIKNKPESKMLVIGDSQVLRSMGKSFQEAMSSYKNNIDYWGIEGTTPNKIIKNHILKSTNDANLLIAKLSQKPGIIIIQLGDNGINTSNECDKLIRYINSFYTEQTLPLILWSGPFPLCIPDNSKSKYVLPACVGDDRCINNYQPKKKNVWTPRIQNATKVFANVFFNSPYSSPPFNDPNVKCFTADGVHINKIPMNQYVDFLLNKELINE
jgi:hypothetical protein